MSSRSSQGTALAVVAVLLITACSSSEDGATDEVTTSEPAVDTVEEDVALEDLSDVEDPVEAIDDAVQDAVPAADPDAEVDVCGLLTIAQAGVLLEDEIREPSAGSAGGNVLGRCTWSADNNGRSLSIWAFAIDFWDESLAFEFEDGETFGTGTSIDGLGARAEQTSDGGLLVDPGGVPHYLQAFVIDTDGSPNFELARAGAELALD